MNAIRAPIDELPYNNLARGFRVLWHQTLGTILKYSQLPNRTINFDCYPLSKRRIQSQMTLSSNVFTAHIKNISDAKVVEVWEAKDISMETGFFYELFRFFNTASETGDYLIWYPKDKTEAAFAIEPLDLIAGNPEEMAVNPIYGYPNRDYRYLREEIRFEFRVLDLVVIPEAIAYLAGV